MTETIFENLSGRKLTVFVAILLLGQLTCFLVGGLIALKPGNLQKILATVCADTSVLENDTIKWFYNQGEGRCQLENETDMFGKHLMPWDLVYVFQMPVPSENKFSKYLRWQQTLVGVMQVDIRNNFRVQNRSIMTLDARLAFRNEEDPGKEWKLYAKSIVKRDLNCEVEIDSNVTSCTAVPLFELSYLSHEYYLLNIRLAVDPVDVGPYIRYLENIWITVINQDESYTAVWVSLKTVFFFIFIVTLIWFYRRIRLLKRKLRLLEKLLLSLGVTNCFLAIPLEYLTLYVDMPLVNLFGDIRQLLFYAKLFSFWLVFAGEHMTIQAESKLKRYWKQIIPVVAACILIFIFDIYERGVQLKDPFFTMWLTDFGLKFDIALGFIIMCRILLGIYFLFLCYKFTKVFANIRRKRKLYTAKSTHVRRMHYEGIIYRFKLLIVATLIVAALTVIYIMFGQVADWKLDENIKLVEYTSVFFTGVYATWNSYIFALIIFYAPSQKRWIIADRAGDNLHEPK